MRLVVLSVPFEALNNKLLDIHGRGVCCPSGSASQYGPSIVMLLIEFDYDQCGRKSIATA